MSGSNRFLIHLIMWKKTWDKIFIVVKEYRKNYKRKFEEIIEG